MVNELLGGSSCIVADTHYFLELIVLLESKEPYMNIDLIKGGVSPVAFNQINIILLVLVVLWHYKKLKLILFQ